MGNMKPQNKQQEEDNLRLAQLEAEAAEAAEARRKEKERRRMEAHREEQAKAAAIRKFKNDSAYWTMVRYYQRDYMHGKLPSFCADKFQITECSGFPELEKLLNGAIFEWGSEQVFHMKSQDLLESFESVKMRPTTYKHPLRMLPS